MCNSELIAYSYPVNYPRSDTYRVRINGRSVDVAATGVGDFVSVAFRGPVEVEVESDASLNHALLQPLNRCILPVLQPNKASWKMSAPADLCLSSPGLRPLFFYASNPSTDMPTAGARGVHYFCRGRVYDVGELELHDGETLYLEGGAVVRGCIRVTGASHVRITGHGILDGGLYQPDGDARCSITLDNCRNCQIEGIVMVRPSTWMIVIGGSQDITVRGVRQLGEHISSDGVDVVGSQRVRIENCFLRNGDDCVVLKALDFRRDSSAPAATQKISELDAAYKRSSTPATTDWRRDVEDIVVRRCVLLSYHGAAAMEIGYETRCDAIRNIRFSDCDILGVHEGFGAPFSIHNGDHATVSDVLWEDIRVEHYFGKLVDFRVLHSRWSKDVERGHVHGVTLRRIRVQQSKFNDGYSISLIGGYDDAHRVEGVLFEDFQIDGRTVCNGDGLELHTKHAGKIMFSNTSSGCR